MKLLASCSAVATLSRVTAKTFKGKLNKLSSKTIERALTLQKRDLWQHRLNMASSKVVAYSDSSFGNCYALGPQLGFMVLLAENTDNTNRLTFASYKCFHVVRAVFGGKLYAFAGYFDDSCTIKHYLQQVPSHQIPPTILNVSESLFKLIGKPTVITEKRFIIDIKDTRESFDKSEISNKVYVRTQKNIADRQAKLTISETLEEELDTGTIEFQVEQCMLRSKDK